MYLLVGFDAGAEAEVDEFGGELFVEDHVFEFDVSVGDAAVVEVLQGACQLPQYVSACAFGQFVCGLLFEGGAEGDARQVLHDYVHVVVGFDDFVDAYDVRVVDQLQDLYLSADCAFALRFADLCFLVGLDCYFLVGRTVDGDSDRGIGALPDDLTDHVVSLELCGEVCGILDVCSDVFLVLKVFKWQSCKHLIDIIVYSEEVSGGEVSIVVFCVFVVCF